MEHLDAVTALLGVLFGFIVGRRERNLRKPKSPYTCDCEHPFALHDKKGCAYYRGKIGSCDCKQYVGIQPPREEETA